MHKFRSAREDSEELSIRGHDIEFILGSVSQVEKNILGRNGPGSVPSKYIKIKEWLVQEQYLRTFIIRSLLKYSKKKIPMFCLADNIRGISKCLFLLLSGKRFIGHTSSEAIWVKNNVRAFFTKAPKPFVVKMLISRQRSLENMKNEISTRKKVRGYGTIKIPEIFNSDLSFDPPFFKEEVVWGRKPTQGKDDRLISELLCPQIWATYERSGLKFKRIGDVLDASEFFKKLSASINRIPWLEIYGKKDAFLAKAGDVLEKDDSLICGLAHGDLCPGNLILTPKKELYLVDWEQTREGPIVPDLYEILTEFPESRQYIESRVDDIVRQNGGFSILPFGIQFCLAALMKIDKWSTKYHEVTPRRLPGLKRRLSLTIKYFHDLWKES